MFKEGLKSGKVKKYKKSNHLTFKQKLFADEYLSNNGNGTQAALKAYSTTYATADVIARENLEKPRIKSYLAEKLRHKDLKKEDVINKLIEHLNNLNPWISLRAAELLWRFTPRVESSKDDELERIRQFLCMSNT